MPAASVLLKRFVGKVRSVVAVRTLLSPVRKGEIWRVQIVWPNGMVRHVGQFDGKGSRQMDPGASTPDNAG
jgi:hypothetical protein